MYIYSWNAASEGAKALKEALGAVKIRNENSKFKGAPTKVVINWGSSTISEGLSREIMKCQVLNKPEAVRLATNKLHFFRAMPKDIVPEWTESVDTALEWVQKKHVVCARTILNGSSAAGLVIMERDNPDSFVRAPLYTKYIPKKEEYRLHVVKGAVIDSQRKTLRKERAEQGNVNWRIRNLDNGFVYQREGTNPPKDAIDKAVRAVRSCGLDFGAVDIVVHSKTGVAYVLEVNTAPGLQGTTFENYAKAFK